jgi:hypothetical protein
VDFKKIIWQDWYSCSQSRHSTTWATLPAHFSLVILEMRGFPNCLPRLASNCDPPYLSLLSS